MVEVLDDVEDVLEDRIIGDRDIPVPFPAVPSVVPEKADDGSEFCLVRLGLE